MKKPPVTRISTRRVDSTSSGANAGGPSAGKGGILKGLVSAPAIANLIAIGAFLVAWVGLGFQRGSLELSRKQLDGDIKDMKQLANDLEQQRRDFVQEQIVQQKAQALIWSSAAEMHRQMLDITGGQTKIFHQIFMAMMISQDAMAVAISSSGLSEERRSEVVRLSRELNAATLLLLDFMEKWKAALKEVEAEFRAASDRITTATPLSPDAPDKLNKLNEELAARINTLNGQYTEKLKPFQQRFGSSRDELTKILINLGDAKNPADGR